MDSNKLKLIVTGILALFAALYLGISAATAQFETIAWVLGSLVLIGCYLLGRSIWMIIPFAYALGFTLMIPGKPDSTLLANAILIGFASLLFLSRKLPWQIRFTELDFWALMLGLCVMQVYMRNPVGLNILGGESVGGRPYFIVAITFVTYLILSNYSIPYEKLRWILRLSIVGGVISFILSIIGYFIPSIGIWYGKVEASSIQDISQTQGAVQTTGIERAGRIGFLGRFGEELALWISVFKSPTRACFHPFWAPLVLLAFACSALSGFRNDIAALGLTFLVGIAYRAGFHGLLISILALTLGITALSIANTITPLPANMQRSLTIFPGTWDEDVRRDAEYSTEWRVEIWKEVMLTDRWIRNKWLGDGLGFSATELAAQQNLQEGALNLSGFDAHRDNILASGDYHSGPIQTIRTIGYIGLLLVLLAQIRLAVMAHRQIQRCRGTPWFPLALLIGIPLVWYPLFFVFVFGTFQKGLEMFLVGAAYVKILEHNLPLPVHQHRRREHRPLALRESAQLLQGTATVRR